MSAFEVPIDKKYWDEIVWAVLRRAKCRCECAGECGVNHKDNLCGRLQGQPLPSPLGTPRAVSLTPVHANGDPGDFQVDNVRAFCQDCANLFQIRVYG